MKCKIAAMMAALAATSFVAPAAFAVDGCAVLLCLVQGGSNIKECEPILRSFARDTALGKPPPKCKKSGGGNNSGSATNQEQYNQATSGAAALQADTVNANPYGDEIGDKYSQAQGSAATAVADAQSAVAAGVRTADTSTVLDSDKGDEASASADGAVATATSTIGDTASCVGNDCTVTATLSDIDPAIVESVQSDLAAEAEAAASAEATAAVL